MLELSSREPKPVEQNVQELIQELIDGNVEAEEFCDRLERLLNAQPQPCLIAFLKVSATINCLLYERWRITHLFIIFLSCLSHFIRMLNIYTNLNYRITEKSASFATISLYKGINN